MGVTPFTDKDERQEKNTTEKTDCIISFWKKE